MFKKFSSGLLIIILAVLMIAYLIVRYSKSDERTFKDKILTFDETAITQILIKDPKSEQEVVDLRLNGDKWIIKDGSREYTADTNTVKNIIKQLSSLSTKRYAGKGTDAWAKYEVTDTSAALVTLMAGDKNIAEIYIGKFSYSMPKDQQQQMMSRQQRGDMTTYVRLADEKDVYAVDGYLKMSVRGTTDAYRYRNLSGVNPNDITRIIIEQPGDRKVLENQDGKWLLNGMPADSASTAKFRSTVARLTGSKFTDQEPGQSMLSHSLLIEGNNFTPVEIHAYPVPDT
ncbi:MAG: DUF4340 domain-containing protein, partial [Bacteroidales bacterium]|nr:DUF4340 domain-containing protein [Bacteroidales bacterium]